MFVWNNCAHLIDNKFDGCLHPELFVGSKHKNHGGVRNYANNANSDLQNSYGAVT